MALPVRSRRWARLLMMVALTLPSLVVAAPGSEAAAALDPTFDTDGKVVTPVGSSDDAGLAMTIQADGKIVVVGASTTPGPGDGPGDFAVTRYDTDGSLDTTFSSDGKVTSDFDGRDDAARAVALQADGKIVVVGDSDSGDAFPETDFALARYNTDGSLDSGFDADGKVLTDLFFGDDFASSVVIQTDGRIVVAGTTDQGPAFRTFDFVLARYGSDGSRDQSAPFGSAARIDFGGEDVATSAAAQSDGKIVVAGMSDASGTADFALTRFDPATGLDATFGTSGRVVTDVAGDDDIAFSLALQSDGKVVVGGSATLGSQSDFALVRLTTAGSLDVGFDSDGKVVTDFGFRDDQALDVALQADGKIVAAGVRSTGLDSDFALARYGTAGGLEGIGATDYAAGDDAALNVAVQGDGRILAAGLATIGPGTDLALARYAGLTTPLPSPPVTPDHVVTGAGQGGGPHVRVFDPNGGATQVSFFAYPLGFTGGVRVAAGDVNAGGLDEIVVAAGPGGGPHVRVFNADGSPSPVSFFPYPLGFPGGVFVATGDVVGGPGNEGDEIITGAGEGGGPHVRVFRGNGDPLSSFFAFPLGFTGGVRVAAGDVDGDGDDEIIAGAGPGGGPHVRAFQGDGGATPVSFFPYPLGFRGGVFVAARSAPDLTGEGRSTDQIVTGAGEGGGPHVQVIDPNGTSVGDGFFAFPVGFTGGVRVAAGDSDSDAAAEITVGAGPGGGPHVRVLEADGGSTTPAVSLFAYPLGFRGGVFVARADFTIDVVVADDRRGSRGRR